MLPYFMYGGSLAEIVSGVMASRSEIKPWSVGAHVVSESGPITVIGRSTLASFGALALWLWLQRKKFNLHRSYSTLLIMGAAVGALITFFDSGTRTWTLMILGAPLITVVLDRLRQKQQVKSIAIGLMLVVFAVMLTQIQLYYRLGGDLKGMDSSDFVSLEDSDFFTETAIAVDLVPGQFEYIQQFEPLLFIANPIPRFLWQNKPFSKTVRIFSMGRSGFDEYMVTGVSRMPSIVGQHYLSWGMIGVLIAGMVWGWAFGLFERLQRSSSASSLHAFFAALGLVWLFTCSRGVYPGFHYPVLIVGLMLFLLKRSTTGAKQDESSAQAAAILRTTPGSPTQ
jgi:oligosaccharide repeat unit polymerase